jgi:hypothetical protein
VHTSTEFSPLSMLCLLIDVLLNPDVNSLLEHEEFVKLLNERLFNVHDTEDFARKNPSLRPELVLKNILWSFDNCLMQNSKRWTGSYVMLEKRDPVTYRLLSVDNDDVYFVTNIEVMKSHYSRDSFQALLSEPSGKASEPLGAGTDDFPIEAVCSQITARNTEESSQFENGCLSRPCDLEGCSIGNDCEVSDHKALHKVLQRGVGRLRRG